MNAPTEERSWACPRCCVSFDVCPPDSARRRYRCEQDGCGVEYRTGQRLKSPDSWRLEPIRMMVDAPPASPPELAEAEQHRRWFARQGRS